MPLDFSRLQLLLIDDNDFMRDLYRLLLEAIGIPRERVLEATNGDEALRLLRKFHVDLAICDLNMKPMDGKQFTRHVRADEDSPDPYLPIIVCTGHAELAHITEARDAGANEILRKPVTAASIYARLQAVVEAPRPFIFSHNFIGPDRRRRNEPFDGPDRRTDPVSI